MPPSVSRATNSHQAQRRGLLAALGALLVGATTILWGGQSRPLDAPRTAADVTFGPARGTETPSVVFDGEPLFSRQSPPILRPDHTGNVEVEVTYAGAYSHLRVFQRRFGGTSHAFDEFPVVATSMLEGRTVSVFRLSWTMGEFVRNFGVVIDFDSGIGARLLIAPSSVPLAPNGAPTTGDTVFIRAMSTTVGSVPVVQIDAAMQYSSHVVNIVAPGMAQTLGDFASFAGVANARQLFYSHFGDDYEQVAFVYREEPFSRVLSGGAHGIVRNRIAGIGLRLEDGGGPGRVEGFSRYLHSINNAISNHELMHQWGHYFYWLGIAGIDQRLGATHDPLWGHLESPLAAFLSANRRLRPLGGIDWETEQVPEPTRLPPLLAYAMGRLPAASVPPLDVFEDQNRVWTTGTGVRMTGTTRRVTIDEIIAHHGPRVGPTVTAVRQATILISRDALATPAEMAYWTLQAQRLEDPFESGMVDEGGIGSFRAVTGVTLTTRIIPPAGGPTLAGHTMLEPDVLDPRDLAGVVVDTAPRFDVPGIGVYRLQGRIVEPALAGATRISIRNGGNPAVLSSSVAPDGSFSITGSPEQAPGRYSQTLFVRLGELDRNIAGMRNVRYFDGVRIPPPPVALHAGASGHDVSIRWSADTGSPPTTYFLDVGSSAGATDLGSVPIAGTALSASGVPTGRYYLRVRAANAAGVSAPSAEAVLEVGGCMLPQPPTTLTGTITGSTLTLAWQPSPTGGVSYAVMVGSTSGASDLAQVAVGTVTSLTAAGVPPGRYFIRVRAGTPCGAADSNEVQVVVGAPQAPGAPGNLTHQVAGATVSFLWQAASGAVESYVIEAGATPGSSNLGVTPIGPGLSLSVPGVPTGTYYVRVRAVNAVGQGPPSNDVTVVVP